MTSAPNLRLPLSGSRTFLIFAICFLAACGPSRRTTKTPPVVVEPPKKEVPVPEVKKETPPPAKPEVYRISYLLPFNTNEIAFDTAGNITRKLNDNTRMMMDYYRGALLALDTVQKSGVKLKVYVYDTQQDTNKVISLFSKPELQQSHLIFGPVYNTQLQSVSPLIKKYKIPLVSPFSTQTDHVERNPYYILANASLRSHAELLYDFAIQQHKPARVFLIFNDNDLENEYASYFEQRELKQKNGVHLLKVTNNSEPSHDNIQDLLSADGVNVVIIPSTDETFVSNMVRKLAGLSESYKINLYGMPQWRDSKSLRSDNMTKLQGRITAAVFFDKSDPATKKFIDKFTARYNTSPTEFALEGYNQALFFTSLMAAKGANVEKLLSDYSMTTAGESFRFETIKRRADNVPETTNLPVFDYIENRSIQILEYKNGRLVKIH